MWFQDELHSLLTLLSLTVLRALLGLSREPPCQQASSLLPFALFPTQTCTTASPQRLQLLSEPPQDCSCCSPLKMSSTCNLTHSLVSHSNSKIQERSMLKSPHTCPAGLCCEFCGSVQHKKHNLHRATNFQKYYTELKSNNT